MPSVDDLMKGWMSQLRQGVLPDDIVADIYEHFRASIGEDRKQLAADLDAFLIIAERDRERLRLVDEVLEEFPDDVLVLMRKSSIYLYSMDDFEQALKWIEVAIEHADRQNCCRRMALGQKARILLKLGRGGELTDVLEGIMALRLEKGAIDVGRERDFVDRAPPGMIRKDVLERYNEFRPKRSTDTSADGPPRYELPDEAM